MRILSKPISLLKEYWRAYLILNLVYYGLVVLGMLYVSVNPALQKQLLQAIHQGLSAGPLDSLVRAYQGGQLLTAMVFTFIANLLAGSFLEITLPSLFVPFLGLAMGICRAALWGLALSPSDPSLRGAMVPHSLTLLIEGQAYIVATLAVYIQGKAFLAPATVGLTSHLRGYLYGLRQTAWLYALVAGLLAVAACYEAIEVILLQPLFAP